MVPFHERFKLAREMAGISQSELARRLGVAPSTISHYEQGTRVVSTLELPRVAHELGREPGEFYEEGRWEEVAKLFEHARNEQLRAVEEAKRIMLEGRNVDNAVDKDDDAQSLDQANSHRSSKELALQAMLVPA